MSNTLISDNGADKILMLPSGSGAVGGALSHVNMEANGGQGLNVASGGPLTNVTVSDSVASGNSAGGIGAADEGGTASVLVRNSTISNNGRGLEADNTGATIWVTRSTITGNGSGWFIGGGGVVSTFGDNDIVGNVTVNNAPTSISHE